jgi:ATP-dependent RNA helicase RhlE
MFRKIIGKFKKLAGSTEPKAHEKRREEPGAVARMPAGPRHESQSQDRKGNRSSRKTHADGGGRHHRASGARLSAQRDERAETTVPREETPVAVGVPVVPADNEFRALGLSDSIVAAVLAKGYESPTPIQRQAIPIVIEGRDLLGTAQTGTGKTAAFALPVLHRLALHGACRCLVLEPTRELALQVEESFRTYGRHTNLRVCVVYGGVGYGRQREQLSTGVDVIVATPGRLLDLMAEGDVKLGQLEVLILDEVDRMLDMGFLPDVRRIIQKCPKQRQTLFFSATLPPQIQGLVRSVLNDPVAIEIGIRSSPAETVDHAFYPVVASQKFDLLLKLLEDTHYRSVIIFTRTKVGADKIFHRLRSSGHKVGIMHSDRSQRERTDALAGFKAGQFEVLVATDVASRGLDMRNVTHVINYDVPENPEDYVHRIGRTGRAETEGDAFTLLTEDDLRRARAIERLIKREVPRRNVEGFQYIYSALFDEDAPEPSRPTSRLQRGRR